MGDGGWSVGGYLVVLVIWVRYWRFGVLIHVVLDSVVYIVGSWFRRVSYPGVVNEVVGSIAQFRPDEYMTN
ncbi:hypothetical protein J3F83DRAFT_749869 [Trichoderma novae-zelandiae]